MSAWNMEEHCTILSVGCLERANIAPFLLLSVFNKFPSSLFFTLCIYIAIFFVSFISVNKSRYEKAIGSAVGFYCSQRIGWMIPWTITLCLQSHWEFPSYGNRCGKKNLLKTYQKIFNYGRTVIRTLLVVSKVLHFRNNNPQLQPTYLTVTLLICVRQ